MNRVVQRRAMRALGFRRHVLRDGSGRVRLSYWHRPATGDGDGGGKGGEGGEGGSSSPPIVFMHGVGLGL
eukprot:4709748-Prymnesium_polylepis.1